MSEKNKSVMGRTNPKMEPLSEPVVTAKVTTPPFFSSTCTPNLTQTKDSEQKIKINKNKNKNNKKVMNVWLC